MKFVLQSVGILGVLIVLAIQLNLVEIDAGKFNTYGDGLVNGGTSVSGKEKRAITAPYGRYWKAVYGHQFKVACKLMNPDLRKSIVNGGLTSSDRTPSSIGSIGKVVEGNISSHNDASVSAKRVPRNCSAKLAAKRFPKSRIKIKYDSVTVQNERAIVIATITYRSKGKKGQNERRDVLRKSGSRYLVSTTPTSE